MTAASAGAEWGGDAVSGCGAQQQGEPEHGQHCRADATYARHLAGGQRAESQRADKARALGADHIAIGQESAERANGRADGSSAGQGRPRLRRWQGECVRSLMGGSVSADAGEILTGAPSGRPARPLS